ncbi:enhancer of split m7 protein-like [Colossoma macropomum]|uniref:enhancer of split m7 protein-like n=1 Tax=Colossoma macropomum TaxID=42526 RepID=UPI0018643BCD|nr:enhancer of split m7 protein-like [Colossoma macropomum]
MGWRDAEEQNSVHGPLNDMNVNSEKKSQRKLSKPLLERRRRARINACLGELRTLLLQSHVTQGCRPSKLEKADILELTVRHLRSLQHTHSGQEKSWNTDEKRFTTPHRPDTGGRLLRDGRVKATVLTTDATGTRGHMPSLRDPALLPSQHQHLSALDKPLTEGKTSSSSSLLTTVWRPW